MQGYAYYPEVNTVARVILVSFCVRSDVIKATKSSALSLFLYDAITSLPAC